MIPRRAAIYARYSSKLQKQTSIEDQIAEAERFCDREGWTVVARFADAEASGRRMVGRDGFLEMIAAVERNEVDVVIIEAVARFSRDVVDGLTVYNIMAHQHVELYSLREGRQNFLNVILNLLGAQQHAASIGQYTRRGMGYALTRGILHTSAYGYDRVEPVPGLDGQTPTVNRRINEAEAAVIRRIFSDFAGGQSAQAIAQALNDEGIPSPGGSFWDARTIRGDREREEGILRNRLYIGEASVNRRKRSLHPRTQQRRIDPTPQEALTRTFPELRIVPQEVWNAAAAELKRREDAVAARGNPRAAHQSRTLLSGLLICGCCGEPFIMDSATSYKCRRGRKKLCENTRPISRRRIEARVFSRLRALFDSADLRRAFADELKAERARQRRSDPEVERRAAEAQLTKLKLGRTRMMQAIRDGAPYGMVRDEAEAIERQLQAVSEQLTKLRRRRTQVQEPAPSPDQLYAEMVAGLEEILSDPAHVDQANRILKQILQRIRLTPSDTAPHGLAAEIQVDLGSFLLRTLHDEEMAAPLPEAREPRHRRLSRA
ncbi:recombinase family protein [Frigidibacter sp. MR17.24]|uniref:recombinase family protein n=1 Tax=Frigidibacter sp. MR17.24 TaxID=3127345 RepID=UPI00301307BB